MSPLFCSDLIASLDQRSSGKKHLLTLANATTLSVSTDRIQRVFSHPDTEIVCVHQLVGLHLGFCSPQGLQYQIVYNIWILNIQQKLYVFGEIIYSQRTWVEVTNSYFFLVPLTLLAPPDQQNDPNTEAAILKAWLSPNMAAAYDVATLVTWLQTKNSYSNQRSELIRSDFCTCP